MEIDLNDKKLFGEGCLPEKYRNYNKDISKVIFIPLIPFIIAIIFLLLAFSFQFNIIFLIIAGIFFIVCYIIDKDINKSKDKIFLKHFQIREDSLKRAKNE